jgi:hypothetical protein
MRRVIRALAQRVPLDDRSRRAIDETLLDWAHEDALGAAPGRRLLAQLRGLASFARVLAFVTIAETWRVPIGWLFLRMSLVLVIPATLLVLATMPSDLSFGGHLSWHRQLGARASFIPSVAFWIAPFSAFCLGLWTAGPRRVGPLGIGVITLMVMFILGGWLAPLSTQWFRVLVYATLTNLTFADAAGATDLARGVPEFFPSELVLAALDGSRAAGSLLLHKLLTPFAAAACVLLGYSARRLQRGRRLIACGLAFASLYLSAFVGLDVVGGTVGASVEVVVVVMLIGVTTAFLRQTRGPDASLEAR